MSKVFIGLGSNLEKPKEQIQTALKELNKIKQTSLIRHSQFYSSRPLAGINAPDFINAVAEIKTNLNPFDLLFELKELEKSHNRQPSFYWGPRTLDLDILLYENLILESQNLTIPHKELQNRDFVLVPLASLEPDLEIQNLGKIRDLLKKVPSNGLKIYLD